MSVKSKCNTVLKHMFTTNLLAWDLILGRYNVVDTIPLPRSSFTSTSKAPLKHNLQLPMNGGMFVCARYASFNERKTPIISLNIILSHGMAWRCQ